MTRLLLALAGVVLLAITALGLIWLLGQMLVGAGLLAVGTAGVLLKLLWFLVVAGLLGGAVYFVSNAWRPVKPQGAPRPVRRAAPAGKVPSGAAHLDPSVPPTPGLPPHALHNELHSDLRNDLRLEEREAQHVES